MRLSTVLRWVVLLAPPATVVLWLFAILGILPVGPGESLVVSTAVLFGLGLISLPCSICLERGRKRLLMKSGLGAALVAAAGWIAMVWFWPAASPPADLALRALGSVTVWAGMCMVTALLFMSRTSNPIALWLRRGTIGAAGGLALAAGLAIWLEDLRSQQEESLYKTLAVLAALTVGGLLGTLVVMCLRHFDADGEHEEEEVRLDMTARCPRCGLLQAMKTGGASCGRCGLRIRVAIP